MSSYEVDYLGMRLQLAESDVHDRAYFSSLAKGEFRLQQCAACALVRYPPASMCPWCQGTTLRWEPMDTIGTIFSYTIVRHAVQPGFKGHTPYAVLLVELDRQKGQPTAEEGLRVMGNLVLPDGSFAPAHVVEQVKIGERVRMVINRLSDDFAIPQWTMASAESPVR